MIENEYCECYFSNDSSQKMYSGVLSFSHSAGGKLSVFPSNFLDMGELERSELSSSIFGIMSNGKRFTIIHPFNSGSNLRKIPELIFKFHHFLEGVSSPSFLDMKISNISIDLDWIKFWVRGTGFNIQPIDTLNFDLQYRYPKSILLYKNENIEINVDYKIAQSFDRAFNSVSLREGKKLNIALCEPTAIENARMLTKRISLLLSMLTYQDHAFEKIYYTDFQDQSFIEYNYSNDASVIDSSSIFPISLTSFSEVSQTVIQNWLDNYDQNKHLIEIITLFFKREGEKEINVFLDLCKAMESFSAIHEDFRLKPKPMFKGLLKRVEASITKEDFECIKESIGFANKPNLHQRLIDLYNKFNNTLFEEMRFNTNLLSKIKDTRNYYTHYGKKKESVLEVSEIYGVSIRMHFAILYMFFNKLGIEGEKTISPMTAFFLAKLRHSLN